MVNLIRNIIALAVVAVTFMACSTMNKSECLTADWRTIGYGDGTKGYQAARISKHRSACAEYAVTPDLNAYNTGRKQGLAHYCIPSTGYNKGLAGNRYNGVCSVHNEGAFLDAFNYGLSIYKEVNVLGKMKREYSKEERHIYRMEKSIKMKEHEMLNGRLSKLKAYVLLNETKEMAEEVGKAKIYLSNLGSDINHQAARIEDMKRGRNYY